MSTDLSDGNQALIEPMNAERKLRFFNQLLKVGLKQIEVAFPSASETDFAFVRSLIEDGKIPNDVTIEVLTQSREDLIRRTVDSLKGAKRAIIHLYNPTVNGTRLIKQLTDAAQETEWTYEYSPETFSMAELDFSKEVCDAVSAVWQPTPQRKMIINLPTTVECSTPNVYADQIEWIHRHLERRDSIILSVHPHNDRGTAVASAELAILAGAERVEGCLFGSGERTGNVDLVTLALNLYSQGGSPGLDFSDIDAVRQCVEYCNEIPVHPRHPYAGDLVFTAFSGSHQDAIKKGFAQQQRDAIWEVPYLPVDPADLGRSYEAVIRVINSQSGKGGIAYLLETDFGMTLPRRLQIEFSRAVQVVTDQTGREIRSADVYQLFHREYLDGAAYQYVAHRLVEDAHTADGVGIEVDLTLHGAALTLHGHGNGPIDAFVDALDAQISIMNYFEHSMATGANAAAVSYVEMRVASNASSFGVGIDQNIVTASLKAVLSGLNRHLRNSAAPAALPASASASRQDAEVHSR